MKLNLLAARILCALLTAFTALSASAATSSHDYDFEQDGIFYKVLSSSDNTVCVTYNAIPGYDENYFPTWNDANSYKGDITISSPIIHNGTSYIVTEIDASAFYGCTNLTSVKIQIPIKKIGDFTFSRCYNLASVNIPSTVTSIGRAAFESCGSLRQIQIPDGITTIEDYTFNGCQSLSAINLPENVTTIGKLAFSWCDFTEVLIPDKVKSIGDRAFESCQYLKSIEIGKGITSIGKEAFSYCTDLELITINAIEPPTAVEIPNGEEMGGTFDSSHYEETDLRVPAESIEKYRTAPVWENFFKDRNPLTGIENVEAAEGAESEVVARYDLSGRPVADDYRGMTIVRRADGSTAKEILR